MRLMDAWGGRAEEDEAWYGMGGGKVEICLGGKLEFVS